MTTNSAATWSVGELAARSGVAVSTLHFYEAQGLITSARSGGNHRRYARAMLRRVAVIRVAQRLGLPLAAIRDALAALPEGCIGCGCLSLKVCRLRNPGDTLAGQGSGAQLW